MSFASFAIGSNDVVAASIAPSIAVLIISATSTNVIESSSAISSMLRDADRDRGDEHGDRDREVDPHVPLRAQHVDDPLERVVEALDDRRPRSSCVRALPRLHLGAVVVAERCSSACTSGARHASPTTCGQSTTSPSCRGTPVRAAARGRRSGRRARRSPRRCRGARASARGSRPARRAAGRARRRRCPRPRSTSRISSHARRRVDSRAERFATSTSTIAPTSAAPCPSPPRAACTPRRSAGRACAGRRPRGRSGRTRCRRSSRGCPAPGSGPTPARAAGRPA